MESQYSANKNNVDLCEKFVFCPCDLINAGGFKQKIIDQICRSDSCDFSFETLKKFNSLGRNRNSYSTESKRYF